MTKYNLPKIKKIIIQRKITNKKNKNKLKIAKSKNRQKKIKKNNGKKIMENKKQ